MRSGKDILGRSSLSSPNLITNQARVRLPVGTYRMGPAYPISFCIKRKVIPHEKVLRAKFPSNANVLMFKRYYQNLNNDEKQIRWETMSHEKTNEREAELYELKMPGEFIGKEVIDSEARKIGIVRSVRLKLVPLEVSLIIKGIEVEFPVNAKDIDVVGSLIKLKIPAKHSEEIEIQDVINLREEIFTEMKALLHTK